MAQVLQQHDLSAAFPPMSAEEMAALVDDIKTNGQREAVILLDGKVLDGWHRYRACEKAGKKCATIPFPGGDPVAFVRSRNKHRRHVTASQWAAVEVALHSWAERGKPKSAPGADLATAEQMAQAAGVSERTIRHAKAAERAGLGDKVRDGTMSAKAAAESVRPVKPAPGAGSRKPAAPSRETQLEIEVADLREKLEAAADEIERLSATRAPEGDAEGLIKRLQGELRATTKSRDEFMRQCSELKKQVRMMERRVK
jgi:ParB-like chromosome segregation protein Spo0J